MGMGKVEEIESVQHRKLIVIIEEPKETVLKKLTRRKKDSELQNYRAALDEYNKAMKEVVEKYWPWKSNGIEYKTYREVEALKKSKSRDYAIIYSISQSASRFYGDASYNSKSGLNWSWDMKEDSEDRDYIKYFTTLIVNVIEDLKRTPVYQTSLPDIFPTKASLVFGMNNCKAYFDYRLGTKKNKEKINGLDLIEQMARENAPKLKTMTLLIRTDWLDKKLPEKGIKNFYPYPYKVVSREEMDDAIMTEKDNTAYIIILPTVISSPRTISIVFLPLYL